MDNKCTTKLNEGEGESSPTPTAKDELFERGDGFTVGLWPITRSHCGQKRKMILATMYVKNCS
jgi:hypothetical protein